MPCGPVAGTFWVTSALRSLDRTTIIATIPSTIATIEPITMPAIAPAARPVFIPREGVGDIVEVVPVVSGVDLPAFNVVVGIGPFSGFVSVAYNSHDGFKVVVRICLVPFTQSIDRKVPRP